MSARARAVVDTAALDHNLRRVRELAPTSRVFAAVKADGYGHGSVAVATALAADGFAVASLDEALRLRLAGITEPIITLSQPLDAAVLAEASAQNIQPVAYGPCQVEALAQYSGTPLAAWLKIDSGMHRLGVAADEAGALADRLATAPGVEDLGFLTHLACADDPGDPMSDRQLTCFSDAVGQRAGQRSIANSAAVLTRPSAHADVVRPGIMLYGSSPLNDHSAAELGLRGVMQLTAPIINRHRVAAGEPIGYGAQFVAERDTEIAVVGIGYGDGYPRHAPSGTPVMVGGHRCPLAGRVSMDMITVDVTDAPTAEIGDVATLWGPDLPADEIATAAGTIAYELFCRLTPRVEFGAI
ncbi:alanine racemase [Salinisphaera orenii]|uniref:alanine racemase n=1 Tax=Salinisphaera orenii TaxID=856731 RepID=UPI000DBE29C2